MQRDNTTPIGNSERRTLNNRYLVLRLLGVGGMAEVYLGHDTLLNRPVAIKAILPELADDSSFAQRFQIEAQAAAQLKSPHIVGIYDVGEQDGRRYIIMEYVDGLNLKEILENRQPLHPKIAATTALQVCQGLEQAHELGIIHRDIKSSNIMLEKAGSSSFSGSLADSLCTKIMDFGIAQAYNLAPHEHDNNVLGSVHYISPEQIEGSVATAESDIYSLGIVLYEACTGRLPFDGETVPEIINQHISHTPIAPRHLNPGIDDMLEGIILKAIDKNPAARYSSAREMQDELKTYLSSNAHPAHSLQYPNYWVLGFTQAPEPLSGSAIAIDKSVILGRSLEADIRIDEESVSRKHARITPRGLYLEIQDLSSSNGTIVNGSLIGYPVLCKAGASIMMGNTRIRIGRI